MTDIREGVVTGLTPPQVRLDGETAATPLYGWLADPAPLLGLRVAVVMRRVPGRSASELWLLGTPRSAPRRAVWLSQPSKYIDGTRALVTVGSLGVGDLRYTVAGDVVTLTDAGWYWLSALWASDTPEPSVRRTVDLVAGGAVVASDTLPPSTGVVQGTLTAYEYLPIGATVRVEAQSAGGGAGYWLPRLTITRT